MKQYKEKHSKQERGTFREELKLKLNSPGCILMSLNKQCFEPIHPYVCPIY